MSDHPDSFSAHAETNRHRFERGAGLLQSRLQFYFRRRCTRPDETDAVEDCVQETLLRVARKIDSGEDIVNLEAFAVQTAKYVFLEFLNRHSAERNRRQTAEGERDLFEGVAAEAGDIEVETRTDCLQECLLTLSPAERELIDSWYAEPSGSAKIERHRAMGEQHAVPAATLRVRIFRLVKRLRACCDDCLERQTSSRITGFVGRGRPRLPAI